MSGIFDDPVVERREVTEDVEIEDGTYVDGDRIASEIVPGDFIWAVDYYETGALWTWDDEPIEPADFEHGSIPGIIENARFTGEPLNPRTALLSAGTNVYADNPSCPLIEHPDGRFAIDGRLMSGSSNRFSPDNRSLGGHDFFTFCGVFVLTELDSSFWVGGTHDSESGSECGRFTLRHNYEGDGIETGWRVNGVTEHRSFGLPDAFEVFQANAVICELDMGSGEIRVYHHSDIENPFGEATGIPNGDGISGANRFHFNSTGFNEGGAGLAYHFSIYDRALSASEKSEWLQFVDERFGLNRDVRWPQPEPAKPYGIADALFWFDTEDAALFEDEYDASIDPAPAVRKTRPGEAVRQCYSLAGDLPVGDGDSDVTLHTSGDFVTFSGSQSIDFGAVNVADNSSGLTLWAVCRFASIDDSLVVTEFGGGDDGTFYFGGDSNELAFTTITTNGRIDVRDDTFTSSDWHIFRCEYDGTEMRIFVDDVEVASEPQTGSFEASNDRFMLGRYDGGTGWNFDGDLAETLAFGAMLSPGDIEIIEDALSEKYADLING